MINMVFGCREQGKALKQLYDALDILIDRCPGQKRFTICCLEQVYNQIRNLPEAYHRGRWLYINYKGTTTFVKKVIVKRPRGFKTVKINKTPIVSKPMDYEVVQKLTKEYLHLGSNINPDCVIKVNWEDENDKNK